MTDMLFHWVILRRDVPESAAVMGDRGVIVDELPFSQVLQESGYTIEVFRQGKTLDVVSVPRSWVKVLAEVWGQAEVSTIEVS